MKESMPSDIFSAGQVLNNTYEIKGVLGRGGTGEVYLSVNQITERLSAIKALNAQFSGNADYLELMKREEQMRNILHDAVVRYSECSRTDDGHVFLVMDFVDGVALSDLMYERRVTDKELLIVAHRVLNGLEATHAQGIVHRDLSPDNIILRGGDADRATIIDFGIAKDTAAGARTIVGTNFAGKYEYAAPEQLDGQADFRTDFYALGASLLAVARREVPDVGTNPGEVVRFKKDPLDVTGIASPLSDLILLLSAPDPDQRPATARIALDNLDRWLKPDTHDKKKPREKPDRKKRGIPKIAIGAGIAAVLAVGLYLSGALSGLFAPALPVVSPYSLTATNGPNGSTLAGYAPDPESAALLRASFADATGSAPAEDALVEATGLKDPKWPQHIADLLNLLAPLPEWQLSVEDSDVELVGLATNRAMRDAMNGGLRDWNTSSGMTLQSDVLAGPESLSASTLRDALRQNQTCGPLPMLGDTNGTFGMFDTVTVSGDVANADDIETIRSVVEPMIGERTLRLDAQVLNDDLCAIRGVMPPSSPGAISIWLGQGAAETPVLTGVYKTGENPVVDIQLPASLAGASLWVMVVDNTGKVFNILPNINQSEHIIDNLGTVENGLRRVRVLWPFDALKDDPRRLAIQVDADNYGKSEVIAILSTSPLFDMRRPRDESVASLASALRETLAGREHEVIGTASRIIDARP